jgi:acylphosphatase
MITGNVQDIGFRGLIEDIARLYNLQGFTFNDIDNSVKIVCCCENGVLNDFLDDIRIKGTQKGIMINEILKEEIPFQIYLPKRFVRLYTDKLEDIGRKLDIGNDILRNINIKMSNADEKLSTIDNGVDNLNTTLSSYVIEQREHNQRMDEHNQRIDEHNQRMDEHNQRMDEHIKGLNEHNKRLEIILNKLAEK